MFYYEIDENNVTRIWESKESFNESNPPMILQPDYPNGDPWTTEQAKVWAEQFILSMNDLSAEKPGPSADILTVPREFEDVPTVPSMTVEAFNDLVALKIAEALSTVAE